jgi:hypothetical protein
MFKNLEKWINTYTDKTPLPWRRKFKYGTYTINQVEIDSMGFAIYSITNDRYQDVHFRGRIPNTDILKVVLLLISEDYDVLDMEVKAKKAIDNITTHISEPSLEIQNTFDLKVK